MQILLVEDDDATAIVMRLFLEGKGYKIYHVSNATKAILAVGTIQFDVAIVDYCLPDFNGGEVVDFYSKHNLHTIVYSGCSEVEVCGRCKEHAIFVQKPNIDRLADVLADIEHFISK